MDSLQSKDIEQLKALHSFLSASFKGSSIGNLKVDDATESLAKVIRIIEQHQPKGIDDE